MTFNFLEDGTFWSVLVLVLFNFFTSIQPIFPNVIWITLIVNFLGVLSATAFHVSAVKRAARASAAVGKVRYK